VDRATGLPYWFPAWSTMDCASPWRASASTVVGMPLLFGAQIVIESLPSLNSMALPFGATACGQTNTVAWASVPG
jgi:hypothetical protein